MQKESAQDKKRLQWLTPSATVLVVANLIPLYGVLFLGWSVFSIIFLFWFENVIVGFFNVLRLDTVRVDQPLKNLAKLFFIPFFTVHYGMFTAVHGIFVVALFGRDVIDSSSMSSLNIEILSTIFKENYLLLAAEFLFISHAFSFFYNYLHKGEYRRSSLEKLMGQPYKRIVVLHLAIIFGGFLLMALKAPIAGLILFIVLKIFMDVLSHLKEHRQVADKKENV